jgi:LacI family transcriptional regulator
LDDSQRPAPLRAEVTLIDVAREAGVHASTVSRALDPTKAHRVRETTRDQIHEVADRLGYRPHLIARGLQSGRTSTIGFIAADLGNTFVTPIIHGLTGSIADAGMLPVIAETEDDHARFAAILDHMLSRRVDGIVAAAARAGDREILESAARIVPVILAARPLEGSSLPQVVHDDHKGGRMVAEHLGDLGHRTVVQLPGPPDVANFPRRANGFSEHARQIGMEELSVPGVARMPTAAEGRRLMEGLLDQGSAPTAVFAHNDWMALGALAGIRAHGLDVPENISLVGYNDLPTVGFVTPPLTTLRYPSLEIGRAAGDLMTELLGGGEPDRHNLEPELIVRSSTRTA